MRRPREDALAEFGAAVAQSTLAIVSRTGVEDGVHADLVLGPAEIVAAWA